MPVPTNDGNLTKRASQYLNNIEHDETTQAKGVAIYGTPDGTNIYRLAVNADGSINTSGSSGGGTEYTEDTASSGGKVGLFGATPVVQPNTTGTTTGFTAGAGTAVNDASTFTGGTGSTAYRISDIVLALKQLGLLAA